MATYAALRLYVDSWRWDGVPFYVRAGKCLKMTVTEVIVEFKNPPQVVFTEPTPSHGQLRALPPEPGGGDRASARAPSGRARAWRAGPSSSRWSSSAEQGEDGRMDAYERLLGDAMDGDATLFARQDVVEAAWAIVDPVIHGPSPLYEYEPGTWGPPQADRLVADVGGWNTPQ